jgi:hypothetical protein
MCATCFVVTVRIFIQQLSFVPILHGIEVKNHLSVSIYDRRLGESNLNSNIFYNYVRAPRGGE